MDEAQPLVPVQTPSPQPSPTRGEGVSESAPCATKTLIVREGSDKYDAWTWSPGSFRRSFPGAAQPLGEEIDQGPHPMRQVAVAGQ